MAEPATITEIDRLIAAGAIVGGKYRLVRKLGAGAMGVVAAAEHLELGESVALKILNSALRSNREALARFTREGKAMFALKGPHVGRVFDVGKLDSGEPFIVMELLTGMTLKELLEKTPRPKLDDSITLMKQLAEAVGEAHGLNIVHRDLKPENIFVSTRDGVPFAKVIDFGMSKARLGSRAEPTLTSADAMLGTPRFMAPEQFLSSQTADARSDVWSLGVIFYRMITGKFPFDAKTAEELLTQIRSVRPKLPHDVATDIRTEISAIAMRCLAQRPQERFANARELGAALSDLRPPTSAKTSAAITIRRPDKEVLVTESEAGADDPTVPERAPRSPEKRALPKTKVTGDASNDLEAAALPPAPEPRLGSFTDELTQKTPRGDKAFPDIDTLSDPALAQPSSPDSADEELDTIVGPVAPPRDDTKRLPSAPANDVTEAMVGKSAPILTPPPFAPAGSKSSPPRADPFSETRRYSGAPIAPGGSMRTLPTMPLEVRGQATSPWLGVMVAIGIGGALSTVAMVAFIRYREDARAHQADFTQAPSVTLPSTAPALPPTVYAPNPVNQGTPAIVAPTAPTLTTPTAPSVEATRAPPPAPIQRPPRPRNTAAPRGPNDPNW